MQSIWLRRSVATALVLCFAAAAVVLLWSDRAGSFVDPLATVVVDTGRSVERNFQVDLLDRQHVPGTVDQIAHALLWGSGMLLIGWALRRRVPIVVTAVCLASISMLFEFAQPLLSQTRLLQQTDLVANVMGISLASWVLLTGFWASEKFLGDHRRHPDEP